MATTAPPRADRIAHHPIVLRIIMGLEEGAGMNDAMVPSIDGDEIDAVDTFRRQHATRAGKDDRADLKLEFLAVLECGSGIPLHGATTRPLHGFGYARNSGPDSRRRSAVSLCATTLIFS